MDAKKKEIKKKKCKLFAIRKKKNSPSPGIEPGPTPFKLSKET